MGSLPKGTLSKNRGFQPDSRVFGGTRALPRATSQNAILGEQHGPQAACWPFWSHPSETMTDTVTGEMKTYTNPSGNFDSGGDTEAFAVP